MVSSSSEFEKIMSANGFVPDPQREAADSVIASINEVARKIGAPPAFYAVDGGYQMHPDLYRLFKENPDLLQQF